MSDYPQDAIARLLGKTGAGEPTFKDQTDVYRAAGCNPANREIHKDVALALARGLEAQMALDEVKEALAGLTSRAEDCRKLAKAHEHGPAKADMVAMAADMYLTEKASAYEHARELIVDALARAGVQMSEEP